MSRDDIIALTVFFLVIWIISDAFIIAYLSDLEKGKLQKNRSILFPEYYPAEEVSSQRWARALLWPITAIFMIPLGIWLVLKFIGHFLAGIGSIYKENM